MRAFLKSQGGGVWRTVETGWTEPVKHSDDLSTTTVKKFEDYNKTEVLAAENNDKALNAIFGAVDATQYRLISNCVLRSLPERFDMDVKAISQSHDAKKMTLDALMGNLETIELKMKEDSKRRKPEKQIAFLGTDLENNCEDGLAFDEEFQEQLSLFTKQFKKKWIQKKGKSQIQEGPSKTSTFRESRFKEGKPYDNSSKYKGPLCFECGGHGHIQTECANNLKKKRQAFSITWSDDDTDEDQGCEESNCAFISQSESDDLVEQHMDLQEKWTELLMAETAQIWSSLYSHELLLRKIKDEEMRENPKLTNAFKASKDSLSEESSESSDSNDSSSSEESNDEEDEEKAMRMKYMDFLKWKKYVKRKEVYSKPKKERHKP
ncbi:unnamed protein product, partial [Cuscuta campestris]